MYRIKIYLRILIVTIIFLTIGIWCIPIPKVPEFYHYDIHYCFQNQDLDTDLHNLVRKKALFGRDTPSLVGIVGDHALFLRREAARMGVQQSKESKNEYLWLTIGDNLDGRKIKEIGIDNVKLEDDSLICFNYEIRERRS